jgi:hypothetical protein
MQIFGRSSDELSQITMHMMDFLFTNFHHLLDSFNKECLTPRMLETFADKVQEKGGLLPDIWGFINRTICSITCPSWNQRQAYNGHKRIHAIKF